MVGTALVTITVHHNDENKSIRKWWLHLSSFKTSAIAASWYLENRYAVSVSNLILLTKAKLWSINKFMYFCDCGDLCDCDYFSFVYYSTCKPGGVWDCTYHFPYCPYFCKYTVNSWLSNTLNLGRNDFAKGKPQPII